MKQIPTSAKGLKGWLKLIIQTITQVNGLYLRSGSGISVVEGESGWIVSAITKSDDDSASSSGGVPSATGGLGSGTTAASNPTGGAWLAVDVVDSSCNRSSITVWAKTS
jgi:hypothetical protein